MIKKRTLGCVIRDGSRNLFVQGAVYADAQEPGLSELGRPEREASAGLDGGGSDFKPGMNLAVVLQG